MNKLLYNSDEARAFLGIGEKAFRVLGVPAKRVGKRKKYRLCDLEAFINNLPTEQSCQSKNAKGRRSCGTTLRSEETDFEEVRKQAKQRQREQSKQSSAQMPYLVSTSNGNRA